MWLMYNYRGHLKIRKGSLDENNNFIPDDKPKTYLTEIPYDYMYKDKLPYQPHIVCNKYMFGKVLIDKEEDIPKWKEFFKNLYLKKIEEIENGYKKKLWENLCKELEE